MRNHIEYPILRLASDLRVAAQAEGAIPMEFLRKLKDIPHGRILLANIYGAVCSGPEYLPGNIVRKLLSASEDAYNSEKDKYTDSERVYDLVIQKIREDVSSYYFKRIPAPNTNVQINTVVDLFKLAITPDTAVLDWQQLQKHGIRLEDIENDDDILGDLATYVTERHFLKANAALGMPHNIFWVTYGLDSVTGPDRVRDSIGQNTWGTNRILFKLTSSASIAGFPADPLFQVAAPTFLEAQDYRRFKQVPDRECHDNWGRTVNLGKPIESSHEHIDAVPEAVMSQVSVDHGFSCDYIGRTKEAAAGDDDKFANRLACGISWDDMISTHE